MICASFSVLFVHIKLSGLIRLQGLLLICVTVVFNSSVTEIKEKSDFVSWEVSRRGSFYPTCFKDEKYT